MMWREPQNHHSDCYFCAVNVKGFNLCKKQTWEYPDLESAVRPVPHSKEIPIPVFTSLLDIPLSDTEEIQDFVSSTSRSSESEYEGSSLAPQQFSQKELNDLIRDLYLSKQSAELLASRLKGNNCLQPDVKVTVYRNRERALLPYFSEDETLVYCSNIPELFLQLGISEYRPKDWRLFINSSSRSLKCVLLHNGNDYASVPIAHSIKLKEEYVHVKTVLHKLCYSEHQWSICVDLKMVNILLGQQSGYTKYPCFTCLWDSRAKDDHWQKVTWPSREKMTVGAANVIKKPLV